MIRAMVAGIVKKKSVSHGHLVLTKEKRRHQPKKRHCACGAPKKRHCLCGNPRDWLEDGDLAWLEKHLGKPREKILSMVRKLAHPILARVQIPGPSRKPPSNDMLQKAKRTVVQFFEQQKALGTESIVYKAFCIATKEKELVIDWDKGIQRVKDAYYDRKYQIDSWEDVYAMARGATRSRVQLVVCGTKPLTQRALTALVCHEGMHCLARRKRQGQVFLSDDFEHVAMALLGDPQIWVD